jgi:hypothetical protein
MQRQIASVFSVVISFTCASDGLAIDQERSRKDPVEWVDSSGKYTLKAQFRRLDGDSVIMRRSDGRDLKIPFDRLSPASVEQAKAIASGKPPAAAAPPAAPVTTSPGTTPSLDNLDAKKFIDTVMAEIKKSNPVILWDALPSKKQKDVEDLVVSFSKQIDPKTFDIIRKTKNLVFEIAKKQQQFILNSAVLGIPADQKSKIDGSYPAILALFENYVPNDFLDSSRLQQGNLRELVQSWSSKLNASTQELAKTLPEGDPIRAQLMDFSGIPYAIESATSSEAKIKIKLPSPTGAPQDFPIVLVPIDGRWLPKEMVAGWDTFISQARAAIGMIKADQMHQTVSGALIFANAPLQNLKNAKTQEEFDKVLTQLRDTFANMAAAQAGGARPAGPPGGFPAGEN